MMMAVWKRREERVKIKDCPECMVFLRSHEGEQIVHAVASMQDGQGRELGLELVAAYMTGYHRRGHTRLVTF